jgi:hypothetical protein
MSGHTIKKLEIRRTQYQLNLTVFLLQNPSLIKYRFNQVVAEKDRIKNYVNRGMRKSHRKEELI